jgi:nudix-type nucleoside diphosphatase (YffH/AdpP family)
MDLFIYGTLRSAALMQAVAGGVLPASIPATLDGYRVGSVANDVVPFIEVAAGYQAAGLLFIDLSADQMARLDVYEGAFDFALTEMSIRTQTGSVTAQCYLPSKSNTPGADDWSLAVWQADHEAPAVFAAQELFAHDPLPSHAALRTMWPMMEARAWSKHRAQAAPAKRRFQPQNGDVRISAKRPPMGSFFRLQGQDVAHHKFDNSQSQASTREVFVGVDAVMVLPYDPKRDKVLLVEQMRMGPVVRQDPNPWMLEPVAGMIDAREHPETAAHREAKEEANVNFRHLEHAGSFYTSPGGTTDYFYNYVGLCELPMTDNYLGGLDGEGEDLRLHPMAFDEAMELLDTGEIATGPLFFLLYWLARNRTRLRSLS